MTAGPAIEVSCADDVAVIANRPLLEQALANLARTRPNTRAGRRLAASAPRTVAYRIDVVDRGPGIPEAHRSHVFERFYRGDGDGEGFGLGLAIVERPSMRSAVSSRSNSGPGHTGSIAIPGARYAD